MSVNNQFIENRTSRLTKAENHAIKQGVPLQRQILPENQKKRFRSKLNNPLAVERLKFNYPHLSQKQIINMSRRSNKKFPNPLYNSNAYNVRNFMYWPDEDVELHIQNMAGGIIDIIISPKDLVSKLKEQIQNANPNYIIDRQILLVNPSNPVHLEDSEPIGSYLKYIGDDMTIHLNIQTVSFNIEVYPDTYVKGDKIEIIEATLPLHPSVSEVKTYIESVNPDYTADTQLLFIKMTPYLHPLMDENLRSNNIYGVCLFFSNDKKNEIARNLVNEDNRQRNAQMAAPQTGLFQFSRGLFPAVAAAPAPTVAPLLSFSQEPPSLSFSKPSKFVPSYHGTASLVPSASVFTSNFNGIGSGKRSKRKTLRRKHLKRKTLRKRKH